MRSYFFSYCFLNLFISIRSCSVSQAGLRFRIVLSLPPFQLGLQVWTITSFCPSNFISRSHLQGECYVLLHWARSVLTPPHCLKVESEKSDCPSCRQNFRCSQRPQPSESYGFCFHFPSTAGSLWSAFQPKWWEMCVYIYSITCTWLLHVSFLLILRRQPTCPRTPSHARECR